MATPGKAFDVWILESNVVYRGVPYTVVADWLQQGRLLDEDRVRTPNAAEWTRLADFPGLKSFVPQPEPLRVEDQAEALEPVELDVRWKRSGGAEDEDVDMIPLIDVSLVLLIFFMMTATVGGAAALIPTPKAKYGTDVMSTAYWIGIDAKKDGDGQPLRDTAGNLVPVYSFGQGDKLAEAWDVPSREQLLKQVEKALPSAADAVVRVKANPILPFELVRDLRVALGPLKARRQIQTIYTEVSGRDER